MSFEILESARVVDKSVGFGTVSKPGEEVADKKQVRYRGRAMSTTQRTMLL